MTNIMILNDDGHKVYSQILAFISIHLKMYFVISNF